MVNETDLDPFFIKLVLLGDSAVGKTTLRLKYVGKTLDTNYLPTLGADFSLKQMLYANNALKFQIWDLSGQPNFATIRRTFYVGAQGALVLYDITNRDSFFNIPLWIDEFLKYNGQGKMPILLLGNKIDLRAKRKELITAEEGKDLAKNISGEKGFPISFLETSALTGINIDKAFEKLFDSFFKMFPQNK
ncbi:MAG: GTPase KRas precursor [Candidatus Heimdallarchaeota archaeon LC_3]|nr:MAG: GTPase KRas precursor [Candidatus Heimdallarchaeota archaeon LC_3]